MSGSGHHPVPGWVAAQFHEARSAGDSGQLAVLLRRRPALTERLEDQDRASPIWSDEPVRHHLDLSVT